jgi:hypothetical protein
MPNGSSVRSLLRSSKLNYSSHMTNEHRSKFLEHMDRDIFLKSVQRAEHESDEANESRETLELWAKRLMPYLDADPHMTIADAIDKYKQEHGVMISESK